MIAPCSNILFFTDSGCVDPNKENLCMVYTCTYITLFSQMYQNREDLCMGYILNISLFTTDGLGDPCRGGYHLRYTYYFIFHSLGEPNGEDLRKQYIYIHIIIFYYSQLMALGNQVGKIYVWDIDVDDPTEAR